MVFLRYFDDHGRLDSAVFTVGADGRDLRCLVPWGNAPSHFDWRSADELLVTVSRPGGGRRYVLLRDQAGDEGGLAGARLLGGDVLVEEGHPSFSPDRRWLVFDGGHDDAGRLLRLYDDLTGAVTVLGHFYAAPQFKGDIRCDLHPRWNRSGTQVSVDSVHGGDRQVYVVDLGLGA